MTEKWKTIKGDKNYEVSNLGRVKSIARFRTGKGPTKYFVEERILKTGISNTGYERVTLSGKKYSVHRLVAQAFIENPYKKKTVNHKDGNKLHNNKSNLEWNTSLENQVHAIKTGLKIAKKGKNNSCSHSVYTINIETGEKLYHGSVNEASKAVGVSKQSLLQWLHKKHKPISSQKIRIYYNAI
jgi:ribosomal protein L18